MRLTEEKREDKGREERKIRKKTLITIKKCRGKKRNSLKRKILKIIN